MSGLLGSRAVRNGGAGCIEYLAGLRWPGGYVCVGCGGRGAWAPEGARANLRVRGCGRQESVTAGTISIDADGREWFWPPT